MKAIRLALSSLRIDLSNFLMLAALYLFLPLAISLFMSFTFTAIIKEESQPELKLELIDEDNTPVSAAYQEALEANPLISLTAEAEADFTLLLPRGFSQVIGGQSTDSSFYPSFQNLGGGSSSEAILLTYIDEVGRAFQRAAQVEAAIDDADLDLEAEQALEVAVAEAMLAMQQFIRPETIETEGPDLAQALNDQYATGFVSYIIIMFAMAVPVSMKNAQKKGIYGRIHSTPSTKADILLSDFYSYSFLASLILILYVLIHRTITGAFVGSLFIYIPLLIVSASVAIAAAILLSALVKNQTIIYIVITLLMILQVMSVSVSGMLTLGEESTVARILEMTRIDQALIKQLDAVRTAEFGAVEWLQLGFMAIAVVVMLSLAVLRENKRKEVRL